MPTISAHEVKAAKNYSCENCEKLITTGTVHVRAYGYAHPGDKPWVIRVHVDCAGTETREKLRRRTC